MIHALKAIKKDQEILLQAMKVFIQEPSMDWAEQSLKLNRSENNGDEPELGDILFLLPKNIVLTYLFLLMTCRKCHD
jgi:hypothetical protein